MKKIFNLILVAFLGGILAVGTYKVFFEKEENNKLTQTIPEAQIIPASYHTQQVANFGELPSFTEVADKSVHAVVHVKNMSVAPANPIMEFFYGAPKQRGQVIVGTGSGVIITPDGYIITNNHVIEGARKIAITLNNQETYEAKIIGVDKSTDIALLKIDAKDLPYLSFGDSNSLKVGEWVLAVGNPYNLTSTVTAGIVSAKARDINISRNFNRIESFIQTDAAVNPGNSGGALVNTRGELVGINTAISSPTGSYAGYSFAVPSNIARKVVEDILEYGGVQRAYLGINFDELDGEKAARYGVPTSQGVIITRVLDKGAASEAGLKPNDVIIQADEVPITKYSDLQGFLGSKRPGDLVSVTVLRNGKKKQFSLKLKNQFGKEKYGETDFISYYFGELQPITSRDAKRFDLDYGVKIVKLTNQSLRDRYGLESGDIILAIEDQKIKSHKEVEQLLRYYQNKEYINVLILKQNGTYGYIRLQ